ncbi:MAG: hypothetical protein ACFFER_03265 [Candidatus Thorarchaeota archaeon]
MTENPKSEAHIREYMRLRPQWIIYFVAVICCVLAVVGGLSYPLVNQGLLNIIAYEAAVILVTLVLLLLIHKRGLPDI